MHGNPNDEVTKYFFAALAIVMVVALIFGGHTYN